MGTLVHLKLFFLITSLLFIYVVQTSRDVQHRSLTTVQKCLCLELKQSNNLLHSYFALNVMQLEPFHIDEVLDWCANSKICTSNSAAVHQCDVAPVVLKLENEDNYRVPLSVDPGIERGVCRGIVPLARGPQDPRDRGERRSCGGGTRNQCSRQMARSCVPHSSKFKIDSSLFAVHTNLNGRVSARRQNRQLLTALVF